MSAPPEIQPKMRRLVGWLNSWGYETTDSGDGVTNVEAGMEGALPFPHVVMVVHPPAALVTYSLGLLCDLEVIGVQMRGRSDRWIEATYDPVDGVATMMLAGLTDADVPQSVYPGDPQWSMEG